MKFIPYIAITGLIIYILLMNNVNNNIKEKLNQRENFLKVLSDSITVVRNKNNELEYSKSVFNTKIDVLVKNQELLSNNQRKLLKEIEGNKRLIAAMKNEFTFKLDSIKNLEYTKINDSTISFKEDNEYYKYNITVGGITPNNPYLLIDKLIIPNEQTVEFEWDNDRATKVIVKNSNKFIEVNELDGYIIPEIKKEDLKPSFKDKLKKTTKKIGTPILIGVIITLLII